MSLRTLLSAFCLLSAPLMANSSLEIIHAQHLDTAAGRGAFLIDKLAAYLDEMTVLNEEIQELALNVEALSPVNDQPQILALTEEITEKMDRILAALPILDKALSIEEDFQQIDTILNQADPLSDEQQAIVDRIAALCTSLNLPSDSVF